MQDPNKNPKPKDTPTGKPKSKEDAIRELFEREPEKAAQLLREILNR